MMRKSSSDLRSRSAATSTWFLCALRSTGTPPSCFISVPNGGRKRDFFPIHEMRTPRTAATASVKGRSQLEVCGAATTTAFFTAGAVPSTYQPKASSQALPARYESSRWCASS